MSLDQYMQEVGVRLKALPEAERDQEIQEIRQHLDSLVEANRACGLSETEAVAASIRAFDSDRLVAHELNRAGFRGRIRSLPTAVRVALFSWSAGLLVSLVNLTVQPIHKALLGSFFHSSLTNFLQSPTVWLGLISSVVLYLAMGGRGLLREMSSLATPWGAAVRWSVLRSLVLLPWGIVSSLYWSQHLSRSGLIGNDLTGLAIQYLGLIPSLWLAYRIGRAAPGKAYQGIVVAALLGPAIQILSQVQVLVRVHTFLSLLPSIVLTSLLWYMLSAAAPVAGAILGGKARLQAANS